MGRRDVESVGLLALCDASVVPLMLRSDDAVEQGVPVVAMGEGEVLAMISDEAVEMLQQGSAVEVLQSDESADDWPGLQLMGCVPEGAVEMHEGTDGQDEGADLSRDSVPMTHVNADELALVDAVACEDHH